MARYLIDTNIFAFYADEQDRLSNDILNMLEDYNNTLCMSAESVKELVVAYRTKNLLNKKWKSPESLISDIKSQYRITVLPVDLNVVRRMSMLQINTSENHNDPSDHIIIAHAITTGLPLISSDRKFPFYRNQGLELITNF